MKHSFTRLSLLLVPLVASALAAPLPANIPIRDAQGREIIPGGYVAITEDRKGAINYTPDDYRRMVRMGANVQVIRTTLGRLGGWPGRKADPTYLKQLDDMVRMGRESGLQTVFKLVIYAPHLYSMDLTMMNKTLDRYLREAALSQAPLLLGEWGPATDIAADTDPKMQARYTRVYQATANALDQRGVGAIKAWFCGTRTPLKSKTRTEPFTWAIFSDKSPTGQAERKFITDTLARPRPLVIAGHLERYGYDFATRTLEVNLSPDGKLGSTEIFVSADRLYPDGFRVEVGTGLVLALKPGEAQLHTVKSAGGTDREQAGTVHWDADSQHIVIKKWVVEPPLMTVRITPLPPSQ